MARQLTGVPRALDERRLLSTGFSAPGIELVWKSDAPIETGTLASDFAYVNGEWKDLDHWRYWLLERRPRDRHSLIAPEAILRITDAFVSIDNKIVTASGLTLRDSRFFGSEAQRQPLLDTDVVADYSGTHGTALTRPPAYGHWLLHRLPRMVTLHQQYPEVPILNIQWGDTKLLARLGIDESGIQRFPKAERGSFVHVDELLVPTHLSKPGYKRVQDANRLERVVEAFTKGIKDDPALPELLYVARRPEGKRMGAENKDELRNYFESLGFTTWYPIDDPMEKQIQHFRAAKVVISEVGSQALTSMFAGPDTTVIIITPEKSKGWGTERQFQPRWRQWQRVVCEARGQHYAQIVAARDANIRTWSVDMPTLRQAMETYPLRVW